MCICPQSIYMTIISLLCIVVKQYLIVKLKIKWNRKYSIPFLTPFLPSYVLLTLIWRTLFKRSSRDIEVLLSGTFVPRAWWALFLMLRAVKSKIKGWTQWSARRRRLGVSCVTSGGCRKPQESNTPLRWTRLWDPTLGNVKRIYTNIGLTDSKYLETSLQGVLFCDGILYLNNQNSDSFKKRVLADGFALFLPGPGVEPWVLDLWED